MKRITLPLPTYFEYPGRTRFPPERINPQHHDLGKGYAIAFSPSGEFVAVFHAQENESAVAIWTADGQLLAVRRLHGRRRHQASWFDGGTLLLTWRSGFALYDPFTDEVLQQLPGVVFEEQQPSRVVGNGSLFALASDHLVAMYDGQRMLWKAELQQTIGEIRFLGNRLAISRGNRIDFWRNGTPYSEFDRNDTPSNMAGPLAFSPDGELLATTGQDGEIQVRAAPGWPIMNRPEAVPGRISCRRRRS